MDEFDRKILAALFQDSSQSYTQLGKTVRLSRENVQYRVQHLQKKGIIQAFVTSIDYRRLGFQHYVICMQFEGAAFAKEQEIIAMLVKHPNFSWVGPTAGRWSVAIDAYVQSREELEKIFQELLVQHGQHIAAYDIMQVDAAASWFWKRITVLPHEAAHKHKPHSIDAVDRKLLQMLADDSRVSYTDLAAATKLTPNACKYRVKALEHSGVIQGYTLNVNHDRLGYQWYTVRVSAAKADAKFTKALFTLCENHPHVLFCYKYFRAGPIDFDIGFIVSAQAELREDLTELRHRLAGQLRVEDIFISFEQVSSHSLPPAVFK